MQAAKDAAVKCFDKPCQAGELHLEQVGEDLQLRTILLHTQDMLAIEETEHPCNQQVAAASLRQLKPFCKCQIWTCSLQTYNTPVVAAGKIVPCCRVAGAAAEVRQHAGA